MVSMNIRVLINYHEFGKSEKKSYSFHLLWCLLRQMNALKKRSNDTDNYTSIDHCTIFNNVLKLYHIVSHEMPKNYQCKTIKRSKLMAWFMYKIVYKIMNEKKYDI